MRLLSFFEKLELLGILELLELLGILELLGNVPKKTKKLNMLKLLKLRIEEGPMSETVSEQDRRAFAYGYLYALKMVRDLKKQHGLKWEQAVIEAGKMLMPLLGIEGRITSHSVTTPIAGHNGTG